MPRNHSASALQGFSICQPFLGAALQFYPALGTQQLDELINAYLPGPATIQEKRATISVNFFEYSQLTGEPFKYYPVYTQSAESSPAQDSGYDSNFVSPVISDWSWSQSTPSSACVSTPASIAQDAIPSKTSKKKSAPASKSQASDFSHIPGMKIMTKDGLDVTNSATRGCKTKEQRDHAHLMRIIKACDACRKKKVRCDPSHKKRTAAQSQSAAPARLAKKIKSSVTQDSRTVTKSSRQQDASCLSLSPKLSFAGLEIPEIQVDLPESWEFFMQFDDDPSNATPFDYDFFFDPEGHLTHQPSQRPTNSSTVVTRHGASDRSQSFSAGQPLPENAHSSAPTLPYLDAMVPANNYVDFNLYSPEPSFLDEDSALVTDIGSINGKEQLSHEHDPAQDKQSLFSQEVESYTEPYMPTDHLNTEHDASPSSQFLVDPRAMDLQRRSLPSGNQPPTAPVRFTGFSDLVSSVGGQIVSQDGLDSRASHHLSAKFSSIPRKQSPPVACGSQGRSLEQAQSPRTPCFASITTSSRSTGECLTADLGLQEGVSLPTTGCGARVNASSSQTPTGQVTPVTVALSSRFSTSLEELTYYANTTVASDGNSSRGPICCGVNDTTLAYPQASTSSSLESHGTVAPLSSRSSIPESLRQDVLRRGMATIPRNGFVSKHSSLTGLPARMRQQVCSVLLMAVIGIIATMLEVQSAVGCFFQIVFGLAMCNIFQFNSSLEDIRPQQSLLSTTLKSQGFGECARLRSCISTRQRHARSQNQETSRRIRPAFRSLILGFTQGFN